MQSNKTGRAFEGIIFEYLIQAFKERNINAYYTERALDIQAGYVTIFNDVAVLAKDDTKYNKLYTDYISNIPQLVDWIIDHFKLNLCESIIIDKFKDSEASENVADIQLRILKDDCPRIINLSLKNNHTALKHSRIGPLPTWLGIYKKSDEFVEYTKNLNIARQKIAHKIMNLSQKNNISIKEYKDLNLIDPSVKKYSTLYKNQEIFPEFYLVIKSFLENQSRNKEATNRLFRYLMSEPHFKIVNFPKEFHIYDFTSVPNADSVTFDIDSKNGYLFLYFDNNYIISIRLHMYFATEN